MEKPGNIRYNVGMRKNINIDYDNNSEGIIPNYDDEFLVGFKIGVEEIVNECSSGIPKINLFFNFPCTKTLTLILNYGTTVSQAIQIFLFKMKIPVLINELKKGQIILLFNSIMLDFNDNTPIEKFFRNRSHPRIFVNSISDDLRAYTTGLCDIEKIFISTFKDSNNNEKGKLINNKKENFVEKKMILEKQVNNNNVIENPFNNGISNNNKNINKDNMQKKSELNENLLNDKFKYQSQLIKIKELDEKIYIYNLLKKNIELNENIDNLKKSIPIRTE